MRVLVIEDDDAIRSVVERGLRAEGFEVDTCADGAEGLWKALDGGYAAIVLDLLLPGMNGYSVCARLREEGNDHAHPGAHRQVRRVRPDRPARLRRRRLPHQAGQHRVIAARLRVLIRRNSALASNIVLRGDLRYDLGSRECTVGDGEVALTGREDQLLRCLLLANGACVTRQELLDDVWGPDAGVDASNLDIYLRRLREKLAPVPIENVRGLGYRIGVR